MNCNVFYVLLLFMTCMIRFTIIFEIIILSILIIIFLSSTILDNREALDPDSNIEEVENSQMDELDFQPKKESCDGQKHENNQEFFINKVDDKITKLGK